MVLRAVAVSVEENSRQGSRRYVFGNVKSRLMQAHSLLEQQNASADSFRFLIDPYDINSIAEAILRILSNWNLAVSMSSRAKEIARRRYLASVVWEKTLKVYDDILLQKHRPISNRSPTKTDRTLIWALNK